MAKTKRQAEQEWEDVFTTMTSLDMVQIPAARSALFDRDLRSRSAIEFHAFAPLEARGVYQWPTTFFSGVHSSYRFTL